MRNIIIPLLIALSAYTAHSEEKFNIIYRFSNFEFRKTNIEPEKVLLERTVNRFKKAMGDIHYIDEQEFSHKTQFNYLKINDIYVYYDEEDSKIWWTIDKDGKAINHFSVLYSHNRPLLKYVVLMDSSMGFMGPPKPDASNTEITTQNGTWTAYYSYQEYKDVLLGIEKEGFAIWFGTKLSPHPRITKEEMRQFYSDFLDIIIQNKNPKSEKETILNLLEKEKKKTNETFQKKRQIHEEKKVGYGISHFFFANSDEQKQKVAEYEKQLGFPTGSEENTNPNVNSGKCQKEWIISIAKDKTIDIRSNLPNSMIAIISNTENETISYNIAHYQTQKDALNGLALMIIPKNLKEENLIHEATECARKLQKRPGLVGDFALTNKPVLNQSGGIIPKSDESTIYFIRGNSAISLKSSSPSLSTLSLARRIDEELKKGINAVSNEKVSPSNKFSSQHDQ